MPPKQVYKSKEERKAEKKAQEAKWRKVCKYKIVILLLKYFIGMES